MNDIYYIRGLCAMLRDINNGRLVHKRDNIITVLLFFEGLKKRNHKINEDHLKSTIERAKELIREEAILYQKSQSHRCPVRLE